MPLLTTKEREEFGAKVRKARKALGITPSILASKIACPTEVISHIEIGLITKINEAALKELCEILSIEEP